MIEAAARGPSSGVVSVVPQHAVELMALHCAQASDGASRTTGNRELRLRCH